jgi:hypothetical protein
MSQQLLMQQVFLNSLCPYECTRTARWNGVDDQSESFVIDGVGLLEATISYPGHIENPEYGMWSYQHASTDVASFAGLATPIHKSEDLTLDECQAQFVAQRNIAPHAVWLYRNISSLGARTGQCIYYLVASSQLQQGVWRGFFKHASHTTNLVHFASINVRDIQASLSNANRNIPCNGDTSKVCIFWSEFDLDDQSELGCFPNDDGTNVVSPTELLADLRNSGIQMPPPSPPPPFPPEPPPFPSPPPDDFVCSINSLPDARFVKDHSYAAPAPPPGVGSTLSWLPTSRKPQCMPCWRWDENLLWPPRHAHHDVFEPQYQCAGESSLSIQWTTSFRQSRLDERFLLRNNDDTCTSAQNQICDDGGDGDVGRRANPITIYGGGIKVANVATEHCTAPGIANAVELPIQEYTVMRIEPQFDSDRLPAVGDEIFIYPDAAAGSQQTVSGNACFDGDPVPNTEQDPADYGKVVPIGPLRVTYVHNEDCHLNGGCYCGGSGDFTDESDVCHGRDDNTYPVRTSYFKARNFYNVKCESVTVTIQSDGLCPEMSASRTTGNVDCGVNIDELPNNKKVNQYFDNYECGMRERVLVFGPTGNYCPYGQE